MLVELVCVLWLWLQVAGRGPLPGPRLSGASLAGALHEVGVLAIPACAPVAASVCMSSHLNNLVVLVYFCRGRPRSDFR